MKKLFFGLLLAVMSIPALADTVLLNFHDPNCGHCVAFEQAIGKEGFESDERSKGLKMEILDFSKPPPSWIIPQYGSEGSIKPIPGTPTFVLYNKLTFTEVGRFSGFGGVDWWWAKWDELLKKGVVRE